MSENSNIIKTELFNTPQYYDVAFSWDPSYEIELFEKVFNKHVSFQVKRILEPCSGSGRFLVSLPKYGYYVLGYDISPEMVAYSQKRIDNEGLTGKAFVIEDNMLTARFRDKFDAAINSINSIGYLFDDEEILTHLSNMAYSLKKGGVYIVQISVMFKDLKQTLPARWTLKKSGIKIKTTWRILNECTQTMKCNMKCTMKINDKGREFILEEFQSMRLWTYEDIRRLIAKSGKFELEAIYSEHHKSIRLDSKIYGETGNLFYVLKRI